MKKYLAIFMSLMMVSSIAVGCGSGSGSSSNGSDTKTVTEAPAEDTSKKDESVKVESKAEEVAESQATVESQSSENEGFNSYDEIYEEYSQKIKAATDGLIEEYKAEAAENEGGVEGLAEISNAKISKLAEIQKEGNGENGRIHGNKRSRKIRRV